MLIVYLLYVVHRPTLCTFLYYMLQNFPKNGFPHSTLWVPANLFPTTVYAECPSEIALYKLARFSIRFGTIPITFACCKERYFIKCIW